ncbi:immunity 49 family protein [Shewanella waksmanii]|uniref:immunity 49 family protein n=1 Tax=Shewanella waksmanii TaxID=213783 RepID=UPI0037363B15
MMKVERAYKPEFEKYVPLEEWLETPREAREEMAECIVLRRGNLLLFSEEMLDLARWLTWETQTADIEKESATGLKYASKMYAAFFECAREPQKTTTFNIYDLPEVSWNGLGLLEQGYINPAEWFDAYFLAVITRDTESMDTLASFPVEIMRQSATTAGPVSYKLVEVFQAYHQRTSDFPALLNECMAMAMKQGNDWALDIAMGYLETFAALTTNAGFDFNEVLAKNLQRQEQYWIQEKGQDIVPVCSFIPLQLLGMACMWYDRGNEVIVESDSLPRFLIDGRYF